MEFGKSKLYVCHYPFSNLPEDDEFDVEITVRVRVFNGRYAVLEILC